LRGTIGVCDNSTVPGAFAATPAVILSADAVRGLKVYPFTSVLANIGDDHVAR